MARYILALVLLAVIAGPALAQKKPPDTPLALEEQQKKKEAEEVDKQYNAMRKNRDQAATSVRVDPWQNMRGADDSKTKR